MCLPHSSVATSVARTTENAACDTSFIVAWRHSVRDAFLCCVCAGHYLATTVSLPPSFCFEQIRHNIRELLYVMDLEGHFEPWFHRICIQYNFWGEAEVVTAILTEACISHCPLFLPSSVPILNYNQCSTIKLKPYPIIYLTFYCGNLQKAPYVLPVATSSPL
jgi:hypothetical protein